MQYTMQDPMQKAVTIDLDELGEQQDQEIAREQEATCAAALALVKNIVAADIEQYSLQQCIAYADNAMRALGEELSTSAYYCTDLKVIKKTAQALCRDIHHSQKAVSNKPDNLNAWSEMQRQKEQARLNSIDLGTIRLPASDPAPIDPGQHSTGEGLRYNEGKLRYDLVPNYAQEQYVRVLTKGATKYAPRNWEKGMAWSKVLASLKRHVAALERGEDRDPETGELHSAHVMCNAAFLTEYYRIYPQGDDRPHAYLNHPRIGLDIDEVLAHFLEAYCAKYQLPIPTSWMFDHDIMARFDEIMATEPEFWHNLKPRLNPADLPFEPVVYITARPLDTGVVEWLIKHGFPAVPAVHAIGPQGKVEACRAHNVEVFVDDSYANFVALNKAGICCYLMDAPHNRRYEVGHKRLRALTDLPFFQSAT